jgi:very-short-patch-repair endonuclease
VYRVGHAAPSPYAAYLAAVLACGCGAAVRALPAGHLLGLLNGGAPAPDVVAPVARRVAGIAVRRSSLDPRELTTWHGVPVTSVGRTLVDLAAVLDEERLARACHEAAVRHRVEPRGVIAVLHRHPTAPGSARLRSVLLGESAVTLSRLERLFLELLREHGLPLPRTNVVVGRRLVDCRWPDHRLIVELDGYRYHHTRHAWEQDRRREREARAAGYDIRRYTWRDVAEEPAAMLRELRQIFAHSAPGEGAA